MNRRTNPAVQPRLATTRTELLGWLKAWEQLLRRSEHPAPIFVRPSWVLAWIDQFGGDVDVRVFGGFISDRLVSFAPMMIDKSTQDRRLIYLGAPLSDESTLLLDPEIRSEATESLASGVLATRSEWKEVFLPLIDPYSRNVVKDLLCLGFRGSEVGMHASPVVSISKGFATEEGLSKSLSRQLAYERRRLTRSYRVSFDVVTELDPGLRGLHNLLTDRGGMLAATGRNRTYAPWTVAPSFGEFLERVTRMAMPIRELAVGQLELNDVAVAHVLLLISGRRILKYVMGWRHEMRQLGLGRALDYEVLRWARQNRFTTLDFGLGNESYKYRFGAKDVVRGDWLLHAERN